MCICVECVHVCVCINSVWAVCAHVYVYVHVCMCKCVCTHVCLRTSGGGVSDRIK